MPKCPWAKCVTPHCPHCPSHLLHQSQVQINGKSCVRKGSQHKSFAILIGGTVVTSANGKKPKARKRKPFHVFLIAYYWLSEVATNLNVMIMKLFHFVSDCRSVGLWGAAGSWTDQSRVNWFLRPPSSCIFRSLRPTLVAQSCTSSFKRDAHSRWGAWIWDAAVNRSVKRWLEKLPFLKFQ